MGWHRDGFNIAYYQSSRKKKTAALVKCARHLLQRQFVNCVQHLMLAEERWRVWAFVLRVDV